MREVRYIESREFDRIWPLREKREALTRRAVEAVRGLSTCENSQGSYEPELLQLVDAINKCDGENLKRLAEHKETVVRQLQRLDWGRRAMHGYRVANTTTPEFIDQRG